MIDRVYVGDISGLYIDEKIDYFDIPSIPIYTYYGCGCSYDKDIYDKDISISISTYCVYCYDSYEDHVYHLKQLKIKYINTWYIDPNNVTYLFTKKDIQKVNNVINNIINNNDNLDISSYKIINDINTIRYSFNIPKEHMYTDKMISDIYRICIGKQILFCLEQKNICRFQIDYS